MDTPAMTRPRGSSLTDRPWVLAVLCVAVFAINIDVSIVNVALPEMSGTFGATIEEITWVVTGYMLSNVFVMPLIAWLSARFGRKRMDVASVLLFTGASMCCGSSCSRKGSARIGSTRRSS